MCSGEERLPVGITGTLCQPNLYGNRNRFFVALPLLRKKHCSSTSIHLFVDGIRRDTLIAIARSLEINNTVRDILFDDREFPREGWRALGNALCNETNFLRLLHPITR
ncbi:hypothetical protein ACHAXS_004082 [Conticribra weissflogii]